MLAKYLRRLRNTNDALQDMPGFVLQKAIQNKPTCYVHS
jgi:hypothetical protein